MTMALPALHIGRSRPAATAGSACTLGAVADAQGVNFAVFSAHAGGRTRENFDRIVRHWSANIRRHVAGEAIDPAFLVGG